jgi:hypothetical protein
LVKVVDSTGVVIDYVYDEVGNMREVKRSTITNPGGLQIFSFSPQQGGPLSTVSIQGLGFSPTPANNIVTFNGVACVSYRDHTGSPSAGGCDDRADLSDRERKHSHIGQ